METSPDEKRADVKLAGEEQETGTETVPFHPSILQRILAFLGVVALVALFCILLYQIHSKA
ncbi:MAG: hypothetical protein IJ719_05850 [Clostridia bacterium]|nr:hypothetical protein [Clostridia bacterium]